MKIYIVNHWSMYFGDSWLEVFTDEIKARECYEEAKRNLLENESQEEIDSALAGENDDLSINDNSVWIRGDVDYGVEFIERDLDTQPVIANADMTYDGLAKKWFGADTVMSGGVASGEISGDQLLDAYSLYPHLFPDPENNRQNDAPSVMDFIRLCTPQDMLIVYVVGDARSDKRVSIEGIYTSDIMVAGTLIQCANRDPDDDELVGNQRRLWWD